MLIKKGLIYGYFIIMVIFFSACSVQEEHNELIKPGILTIGIDFKDTPSTQEFAEGKIEGFFYEMGQDLAKYLGLAVNIKNIPKNKLIEQLKKEKIDIVLSSLNLTKIHTNFVAFSKPYVKVGLSLLISKKSEYQSQDLLVKAGNSAHISIIEDEVSMELARSLFPQANIDKFKSIPNITLTLALGKSDALLANTTLVSRLVERNPQTTYSDLSILPGTEVYWAVAYAKRNKNLRIKINDFLYQYKEDKAFEKLSKKYLGGLALSFEN